MFDVSRSIGGVVDIGDEEMATAGKRPHLVGTLDYTAPETHAGEKPTNRADIYALGVIAYEMLTGRLPYGQGFASLRDIGRRGNEA